MVDDRRQHHRAADALLIDLREIVDDRCEDHLDEILRRAPPHLLQHGHGAHRAVDPGAPRMRQHHIAQAIEQRGKAFDLRLQIAADRKFVAAQPLLDGFVLGGDQAATHLAQNSVFVGKIAIERGRRQPRPLGDHVCREALDADFGQQFTGRLDDLLVRRAGAVLQGCDLGIKLDRLTTMRGHGFFSGCGASFNATPPIVRMGG